ncbi:MAG: N-formylglutamate amidohydrolase [Alphaproteobacteria bacterium]|nr:N-formylglutamate amidohydrolase [Alphaproteobacteria bacterium]
MLGPGDPAPFQVVNAGSDVPLMFVCDHADRAIPAGLDNLGLDETVLCRHIAWDIGAADVARRLANRFQATLVHSRYSRLVIDPNRNLDDPTSIPVISDGVIVPGNRDLSADQAELRASACFQPYHEAIDATLADFARRGITPAFISIHSFTPVFKGQERPWHFGVLWNEDSRIAGPLIAYLGSDPAIVVGDNQPYSGRDHYGFTVETHAEGHGLPHVLIELRQDLIDTRHGADEWAGLLGDALAASFKENPDMFPPANDEG